MSMRRRGAPLRAPQNPGRPQRAAPTKSDGSSDPLLDPGALDRFLRTHHLPPLDRFGQHFLIDADALEDIVAAAETDPAIPVIEIGAGLGVLTRALARVRQQAVGPSTTLGTGQGSRQQGPTPLIAVELDRRLIPLLKVRTKDLPAVFVVQGDILNVSVVQLLTTAHCLLPTAYDVIGNIPYNLTGAILRKFLGSSPRPRRMTILMDDAVATAITARPPDMSLRAVSVQAFAAPRIVRRRIPPAAFVPSPAVHSAIVTFTCHLPARRSPEGEVGFQIPEGQERAFFRLVRAGFSQKRKVLSNALAATYRLRSQGAAERLRAAGIDPRRRAETLSLEEWKRLLTVWETPPADGEVS